MTRTPLIQVAACARASAQLEVLRGVELDVQRGEVLVIIGPSGSRQVDACCAASTSWRVSGGRGRWFDDPLVGYRKDDAGRLRAAQRAQHRARVRARIGMVFQQFNLFPHMTVLENVMEGPVIVKNDARRAEAEARARDLLARGRPRRQARRLSARAVGRPAAARRHRPRAGDGARGHAVRRADLGARSRAGGRGARRHEARSPPRA